MALSICRRRFKLGTIEASIILLLLSKGRLWLGTQQKGFGLLYFLCFLSSVGCSMSVVCWWWLQIVCVGDSCLLFVVGLWFSRAVDLSLPGVTILMVPGLGVLLLNFWLSVLVVAHFFRCRCPALWISSCFSLNEFVVYKNNLWKYRYLYEYHSLSSINMYHTAQDTCTNTTHRPV